LTTQGNRLVNAATGAPVALRGLNWFGFNVGMGMVDGLWAGGHAAATDFGLIAYQLRLLGYNSVRLPFRWKDLEQRPIRQVKDCDPVSYQFLRDRLVSPNVADKYRNLELPANVVPLRNDQPGYCNTYVPNSSGWDRLMFVVQAFVAQGMYVVLDYQPMGTENHAYSVQDFVNGWKKLWANVACLPNFQSDLANRIFVDAMNEPDSMQIRWEPEGGRPGARELYLSTADALWQMTPNKVLFMFEGTGQNMYGLNWGNGFITDRGVISSRGLSDANPFFQQLVRKPYLKSVVLTPHMYPPSITRATFLGTALWQQSRTAWGYLQERGYCENTPNGKCVVFPIVMGETGSAFESSEDKQWLNDFADFANAEGGAKAYNSVPINGWLWWAYNENSGDTGGIVHNGWQDLHWDKLNFMISRLGLRPWYLRAGADKVPRPEFALPTLTASLLPGGGVDGGKAAALASGDNVVTAYLPGFSISVQLPKYGSALPIVALPYLTFGPTAPPVTPESVRQAAAQQQADLVRQQRLAAATAASTPSIVDPLVQLASIPAQMINSFTSILLGGGPRVLADVKDGAGANGLGPAAVAAPLPLPPAAAAAAAPNEPVVVAPPAPLVAAAAETETPVAAPPSLPDDRPLTPEERYKAQQAAKWQAILKRVAERRARQAAAAVAKAKADALEVAAASGNLLPPAAPASLAAADGGDDDDGEDDKKGRKKRGGDDEGRKRRKRRDDDEDRKRRKKREEDDEAAAKKKKEADAAAAAKKAADEAAAAKQAADEAAAAKAAAAAAKKAADEAAAAKQAADAAAAAKKAADEAAAKKKAADAAAAAKKAAEDAAAAAAKKKAADDAAAKKAAAEAVAAAAAKKKAADAAVAAAMKKVEEAAAAAAKQKEMMAAAAAAKLKAAPAKAPAPAPAKAAAPAPAKAAAKAAAPAPAKAAAKAAAPAPAKAPAKAATPAAAAAKAPAPAAKAPAAKAPVAPAAKKGPKPAL
jgi:aryl-phospho-beta-D-glucosidase BglC (GH1 family)